MPLRVPEFLRFSSSSGIWIDSVKSGSDKGPRPWECFLDSLPYKAKKRDNLENALLTETVIARNHCPSPD